MTPCRVFLTGEPGCGKTTAIRKTTELLRAEGIRIAGIITSEIREKGVRVGFSIEDLQTKESGLLAHVNQKEGPRVGKYHVNLPDIQRIGVRGITRAISSSDVIVVDELGPMELNSEPFIEAVRAALASPKPFIGTIHKHASHPLITAIKSDPEYQIVEVTLENRHDLPGTLMQKVRSYV